MDTTNDSTLDNKLSAIAEALAAAKARKAMLEEHRTIRRRFAVINEPFNAGEGMELQAGVEFRLTRPSRADVLNDGSLLIKPAQGPDIRVPESGYHVREEIEEIYMHPRKE